MAYFICHGLCLKPYVFDTHLGFCNARCFEQGLRGGINYTIWVLNCVNGDQGGDINVSWNSWPLFLGLGLSCWFGQL